MEGKGRKIRGIRGGLGRGVSGEVSRGVSKRGGQQGADQFG